MPKNAVVPVAAGGWVELTDADVTDITVIHKSGGRVALQGTSGAAPADANGDKGTPLGRGDYGFVNYSMAELFPDVTGPVRVWAWTDGPDASLLVRHA